MRSTDKESIHFKRSPRYINLGDQWYFKTREGDLLGPYNSITQVHSAAQDFVVLITNKLHS
ncbi:MAG: hypothetical protein HWE27_09225 [Gammaproteobacteria bacterium]|nr:hypothetical protein [Gammaproteobacteria bacterium]